MAYEDGMDQIRLINKIFVPLCLIICPVGIIFFLYALAVTTEQIPARMLVFPFSAISGVFTLCIWYSRRVFGWFRAGSDLSVSKQVSWLVLFVCLTSIPLLWFLRYCDAQRGVHPPRSVTLLFNVPLILGLLISVFGLIRGSSAKEDD